MLSGKLVKNVDVVNVVVDMAMLNKALVYITEANKVELLKN